MFCGIVVLGFVVVVVVGDCCCLRLLVWLFEFDVLVLFCMLFLLLWVVWLGCGLGWVDRFV